VEDQGRPFTVEDTDPHAPRPTVYAHEVWTFCHCLPPFPKGSQISSPKI
jgi:hypothetical protein